MKTKNNFGEIFSERKTNEAAITGTIEDKLEYCYTIAGKDFYSGKIVVKRQRPSTEKDIIPIIIPKTLLNKEILSKKSIGKMLELEGEFRSRDVRGKDEKMHLELYLFVKKCKLLHDTDENNCKNEIRLEVFLVKTPIFRKTPVSKLYISDLLVAVNRINGRSDYIPCIAWNRNATLVSVLDVGAHFVITGRIQSRIYVKEGLKTAYEVSAFNVELLEE